MLKDFVEVGCRITIARVAPFNKSKWNIGNNVSW
jgi:hypothetical protein